MFFSHILCVWKCIKETKIKGTCIPRVNHYLQNHLMTDLGNQKSHEQFMYTASQYLKAFHGIYQGYEISKRHSWSTRHINPKHIKKKICLLVIIYSKIFSINKSKHKHIHIFIVLSTINYYFFVKLTVISPQNFGYLCISKNISLPSSFRRCSCKHCFKLTWNFVTYFYSWLLKFTCAFLQY